MTVIWDKIPSDLTKALIRSLKFIFNFFDAPAYWKKCQNLHLNTLLVGFMEFTLVISLSSSVTHGLHESTFYFS